MNQELPASAIFEVVEVLIIGSLLVLLPGGQISVQNAPSESTASLEVEAQAQVASDSAQLSDTDEPESIQETNR